MKGLMKWLLLPTLALVGLTLLGLQPAEAARWRRHSYRHTRVYRPAPRVQVAVPRAGVDVRVGPGVDVRVGPRIGVHVGSAYRPYYRGRYRVW